MSIVGERQERISVIVPRNPFTRLQEEKHCLCALPLDRIMEWWPGTPYTPHRDPEKVRAIQRSLDWKRVVHIAAYLLQREIRNAPTLLDKYFRSIYEPRKLEPGREWPPRVPTNVRYEPSRFPSFSNILVHMNGAKLVERKTGAWVLTFDSSNEELKFTVIDGQHRINGGYLALRILQQTDSNAQWEIPAEVFLDLDPPAGPPRTQAQIFIDVNFYQKKVDRSLVTDLFSTTRGGREPINTRERAQDVGRRLMLETGPLVGMVQIPGIKYGVKDVVALATLVGAIEDTIPFLDSVGITDIYTQTEFLAQMLTAWLDASGRRHEIEDGEELDPQNVAYQGRVLVSILSLTPAAISMLKRAKVSFVSTKAEEHIRSWFRTIITRAGFMKNKAFINRNEFKRKGFLGSGGIAKFRNRLWAALEGRSAGLKDETVAEKATTARDRIFQGLGGVQREQ